MAVGAEDASTNIFETGKSIYAEILWNMVILSS
jgi:hypothetical protein